MEYTLDYAEKMQAATQHRATEFDVPMPPLTVENMDDDGVINLYTAVIEQAKHDYIKTAEKLLAGKCTYRAKAEKELNEIIAFFDHIGIKDDRKDKLIASLEGEAEEWWECYQNTQQELAARAWVKLGRCLDDDIY